jgi:two-component system nitrogen regulation response regulator GlnG
MPTDLDDFCELMGAESYSVPMMSKPATLRLTNYDRPSFVDVTASLGTSFPYAYVLLRGCASAAPFEFIRTTTVETAASAPIQGFEPILNVGEATQSVERALDFLHVELSQNPEPILARLEREMIARVLRATEGNMLKAAEKLGMTRATLRKRVDELGLKL